MAAEVSDQSSIGTCYHTGPAPDALFGVDAHLPGFRIFVRGSGEAGVDAHRLLTMATLDREAYLAISLYSNTGKRTGFFPFKGIKDVLRFGMCCLTVNSTQTTAHTGIFFYIDFIHNISI
jgi:hypothetical protein